MTVKELIERLQYMPGEAIAKVPSPCFIDHTCGDPDDLQDVSLHSPVALNRDPEVWLS